MVYTANLVIIYYQSHPLQKAQESIDLRKMCQLFPNISGSIFYAFHWKLHKHNDIWNGNMFLQWPATPDPKVKLYITHHMYGDIYI